MSLFTKADLIAGIPEAHILLALDDDANGAEDPAVFPAVLADATAWITGYLEQAGLTIPTTVPARLKHLGLRYAEYSLWRRRGHADRSRQVYEEWIKPGAAWLEKLARGEEALAPGADTPGGLVSEPSRLYSPSGAMMV